MTLKRYIKIITNHDIIMATNLTQGKFAMNLLRRIKPELADSIIEKGPCDPIVTRQNLSEFIKYLQDQWDNWD